MGNEAEIETKAGGKRWGLMAVFGALVVLFIAMAVSSKASTRLSLSRQTPCRCAQVNSQPLCVCVIFLFFSCLGTEKMKESMQEGMGMFDCYCLCCV